MCIKLIIYPGLYQDAGSAKHKIKLIKISLGSQLVTSTAVHGVKIKFSVYFQLHENWMVYSAPPTQIQRVVFVKYLVLPYSIILRNKEAMFALCFKFRDSVLLPTDAG